MEKHVEGTYFEGYEEGFHDGLAIGRKAKPCNWEKGKYGTWWTGCKVAHCGDLYTFCPHCGGYVIPEVEL